MGRVKHAIHEAIESCDCYQQAADRIEEMGLGTHGDMLIEFWNGLFEPDEKPKAYKLHSHNQFVRDMLDADLEPYHYRGRFYYEGPAVNVDDLQEAIRATKVNVQWDNMGLGWVVYPA